MNSFEPFGLTDSELAGQFTRRSSAALAQPLQDRLIADAAEIAQWNRRRGSLPRRLVAIAAIGLVTVLVAVGLVATSVGTPPPPDTSMLSGQDLVPLVSAARQSGETKTVLANVTVDAGPVYSMLMPICQSDPCNLPAGFVKVTGSPDLLLRAFDDSGFPAFFDADHVFRGVLALDVTPDGLQFLGVVDKGSAQDLAQPITDEALRPGAVVVVDGYFWGDDCPDTRNVQVGSAASCAYTEDVIGDRPLSASGGTPGNLVEVQPDADRFAASAETSASYVLQPTTLPGPRWSVIGRVGQETSASVPPTPTGSGASPSPQPSILDADGVVLTLDELQAAFAAAQDDGLPRTVIADVALGPSNTPYAGPVCQQQALCPQVVGEIVGMPGVPVLAVPGVAATLPNVDAPTDQLLALNFGGSKVITLLGIVDPRNETTVVWPSDESQLAAEQAGALAHVIAVHGWMSWSGPIPCPLPPQETPTIPPNSPFAGCPWAWISAQPDGVSSGSTLPPADSIPVQWEAYGEFAPGGPNASVSTNEPIEGIWLLRLVEDPRPDADPKRGWQVVGHVDDATVRTPDDPRIQDPASNPINTRLSVRGWLVDDGGAVPCPTQLTPKTPPPDIYEPSCFDGAWITRDEYQPITSQGGGFSAHPPDAATSVRVQGDAYQQFAPDPQLIDAASTPRLGTYQIQLIRDPRFPVHGALGWRLVARLDP